LSTNTIITVQFLSNCFSNCFPCFVFSLLLMLLCTKSVTGFIVCLCFIHILLKICLIIIPNIIIMKLLPNMQEAWLKSVGFYLDRILPCYDVRLCVWITRLFGNMTPGRCARHGQTGCPVPPRSLYHVATLLCTLHNTLFYHTTGVRCRFLHSWAPNDHSENVKHESGCHSGPVFWFGCCVYYLCTVNVLYTTIYLIY